MERLIGNGMAPGTEVVPASEAAGRVTSAPVYARLSAPVHDMCALDGIALDAKLTRGAGAAGPVFLDRGQFAPVSTGGPVPEGCNAVIPIEEVFEASGGPEGAVGGDATGSAAGGAAGSAAGGVAGRGSVDRGSDGKGLGGRGSADRVRLFKAAEPWQNIRRLGEDINAGDMILPSFSKLSPAALGVMYASGVKEIQVVKRPVVGIIPAGGGPTRAVPGAGAPDATELNSTVFSAMLREWGAETVTFPVVKDDTAALTEALVAALAQCDAVILNASPPAGGEGCSADAIRNVGEVLYHGLAIKPGKPAVLGYSGVKPVLGVPGYPVSGIIVVEQIMRPIVEYLCAGQSSGHSYVDAILSRAVASMRDYKEFVRVRIGHVNDRLIATPLNRGSGLISSFMKADGILEVPQDAEGYETGDKVNVRLLSHGAGYMNNLVAIGSHDPLLDEISELLRLKFGHVSLVSANAGSMAGLVAVRRGEAHLAGTHLLDEKSGRYNEPFIKKIIPRGKVRLVECVNRVQGFIIPKGNPLGICGVRDLQRGGLRFVNRQTGSGSRVLFDYLCATAGVDPTVLDGYYREEYTHTSVAAQVAAGTADAGLGIFSAARMFGLDFVPVCEEQYDLLIPDHSWDNPLMRMLMVVLKSDEFRAKLDAMGGYVVANPGAVRGEW